MKAINEINDDGTAWNGSKFWTYFVPSFGIVVLAIIAIGMALNG